ncbi:hypothetical protein Gotri_001389, partial [Gossypium trilobum]|nr:hypothetical protein [Gossypium trilobum]
MEEELANLILINKEEEAFREEAPMVENDNKLCMVRRCLTNSVVHFPSLRNTITDLWHPIGGYSYQILIQPREDSMLVSLLSAEFWVQVHDLPPSFNVGPSKVHENQSEVGCESASKAEKEDISLYAVTRRRTAPVSRWLGEVDGPVCRNLDKKSGDNGHNGGNDRDIWWIWKGDLERLYLNLNYIPLGPRIEALNYEHVNQQNTGCEVDNRASNVSRPIDLILEWENDPLHTMDEQSRAMKILSWNIRRLGKLWIVNCLKNKLRYHIHVNIQDDDNRYLWRLTGFY